MKILLLTDRLANGGAETHIAQLAIGLRRMGIDVTLLSSGGKCADALEAMGFRHICLPTHTHNPFRWFSLRRRLVKLQKREKFDILHAHARIPALLLHGMSRHNCSVVVSVHARFSVNAFLRRICYWGDCTVAVSEDLRTYAMREYRIPPERISVIPNGIDCDSFTPRSPTVFPQTRHTARILFASRLDRDCSLGAELLLRIAPSILRQFPDTSIGIVGGGNDYERIAALAQESNHIIGAKAITLYGWVEDMPNLLKQQDIFIGVSRAAMEASACGCAVILCGNEGYLGILDKNRIREASLTNFCCRNARTADIYRLQTDLAFLLSKPDDRSQIAAVARDEILHRFGAERMCRETLMLYHRILKKPHVRTILIGGYFGCGNLGDDAILLGFLEGLHSIAKDIRVIALSGHPHKDRRRFGIECINRRNPIAIMLAMLRANAFLCGGGSLLQNATSNRSLFYYLHLLKLSKMLGAHPMLYAAGIGPLYGERARKETAKVLPKCDYLSLRDPDSLSAATELGIDRAKLHLGADPALIMPLPPSSRKHVIAKMHDLPTEGRILCIVLKGGNRAEDECRIVIAAARMLCHRHGFFPMVALLDRVVDERASQRAASILQCSVTHLSSPKDATALFSNAILVITMRLHAMILSTTVAIPSIGIPTDSADEKIMSFAKLSGQKAITREKLSVAHLVDTAEGILSEKNAMQSFYADTVADLRKKAKKDLENITTMIYNIDSK